MKKFALVLLLTVIGAIGANAQKFALVDMEYILRNVPSYEMASEQLNQLSQRWQREIENIGTEAQTMYQSYLADKSPRAGNRQQGKRSHRAENALFRPRR